MHKLSAGNRYLLVQVSTGGGIRFCQVFTILTCTRTSGQSPKWIILTGSYLPDGAMIHQVTRGGKGSIASSIRILSKCQEPFALISYFFSHGCDL